MFNPERLLGQLLRSGLSGSLGGGRRRHRGGSLLGGLSTGTKAQMGMGLVGLAIAAYEHYTKQSSPSVSTAKTSSGGSPGVDVQPVPSMPRSSKSSPTEAAGSSDRATDATLLVQAMVAAAAADGVIDETERAQILRRANEAGFDEDTKRFLEQELTHPASLAVIVSKTRKELATDVYAASFAAITPDTDAERIYLDTLAKHLGLSAEARADIEGQLGLL